MSYEVDEFFTKRGIIRETSCPCTPPQNRVVERKNYHILDVTRSILFKRNVPSQFWGEAVLASAFLINRMSSQTLKGKTLCVCFDSQ